MWPIYSPSPLLDAMVAMSGRCPGRRMPSSEKMKRKKSHAYFKGKCCDVRSGIFRPSVLSVEKCSSGYIG